MRLPRAFLVCLVATAIVADATVLAAQTMAPVRPVQTWRGQARVPGVVIQPAWPSSRRTDFGGPRTAMSEARFTAAVARAAAAATHRPWWRYPLIGAGVGGAVGLATGLYFVGEAWEDPIFDPVLVIGLPVALGAVGGGLVGALLDGADH